MYDDNVVSFAKRVNFDIGCQMDFRTYPIDLQKCPVNIQSFRYRPEVTQFIYYAIKNRYLGGPSPPFPLKITI